MNAGPGKAHLEVALACMIYGMAGLFLSRINGMGTGAVLFYEMLIGLLTILGYLAARGRLSELRLRGKKGYLLLLGVLICITFFSYFTAIRLTCVSVAVLLQYTSPIYVTLLSPLLLKEKVNSKSYLALFLALAGVFLVVMPENGFSGFELEGDYRTGLIFGLLSGFAYAAVILNIRYLKDEYPEMAVAFWPLVVIVLLTAPLAYEVPGKAVLENLEVLLLFGLISGGLGEILYTEGLSGVEAQVGSILALVEPVSGIFFDYIVLGVSLYLNTFLGCVLILAAGLLVSLENFRGIPGDAHQSQET